MWGHRKGAPCIPPDRLYAMHITPQVQRNRTRLMLKPTGPELWADALHILHAKVLSGECIDGFT